MATQVVPNCAHLLPWLKTEPDQGRGTTGAIVVVCAGCKEAWRGGGAFMIVVKSFQADATECRREFYALSAKVKAALEDVAFLEKLTRDSKARERLVNQAVVLDEHQARIEKLEAWLAKFESPITPIVSRESINEPASE